MKSVRYAVSFCRVKNVNSWLPADSVSGLLAAKLRSAGEVREGALREVTSRVGRSIFRAEQNTRNSSGIGLRLCLTVVAGP